MRIQLKESSMLKFETNIAAEWILGIEIDGEWEHCRFSERHQALTTFAALASDYPGEIQKAVLLRAALLEPGISGIPASTLIQ
jgi:hypothetical protein